MLVRNKVIILFKLNIVLALVSNKKDLIEEYYDKEEVTKDEGITFAMEINAIYKIVSAKTGEGIDDLFKTIGKIFLHRKKNMIIPL